MTFTEAVKSCLRKYATFSGRAPRSEYWWFVLFCMIGGFVFGVLESIINQSTRTANGPTLLTGAFNLATLIPTLAVGWRRMHDIGRSGLYYLYPLIVTIGVTTFLVFLGSALGIGQNGDVGGVMLIALAFSLFAIVIAPLMLLWWLTRPSQPGPNEYGPNPYEVTP